MLERNISQSPSHWSGWPGGRRWWWQWTFAVVLFRSSTVALRTYFPPPLPSTQLLLLALFVTTIHPRLCAEFLLFMGANSAQTHTLICHHRINSFYSQIKMLFSTTLSVTDRPTTTTQEEADLTDFVRNHIAGRRIARVLVCRTNRYVQPKGHSSIYFIRSLFSWTCPHSPSPLCLFHYSAPGDY